MTAPRDMRPTLLQHAVVQKQSPVRLLRVRDVVGHKHERGAGFATQREEQFDYGIARVLVEVARRLIGEQELG